MDDADRERKLKSEFKANAKIDVSRFKGLGEMPPAALKETTMDPARRTLLKVVAIPEHRARTERGGGKPDGTAPRAALPVHPGACEECRRGGRVSWR